MSLTLTLSLALIQLPGGAWDDPIVGPPLKPGIWHFATATPDLDGDGQDDVVAALSRYETAEAVVLSGADASIIHFLETGATANLDTGKPVVLGDINGDGLVELVIQSIDNQFHPSGIVHVFDGATGALLDTIDPPPGYDDFGWALAGGQDLDGDGIPDLVISNPHPGYLAGQSPNGTVFVYSGATIPLNQVQTITIGSQYGLKGFGHDLSFVPDRDGDQRPDLAVAVFDGWVSTPGAIFFVSTATGNVLSRLTHPNNKLGWRIESAGDVDFDGREDLLVHGRDPGSTAVNWFIYSERSLMPIREGWGEEAWFAGDLDGDGAVDLSVRSDSKPLLQIESTFDGRLVRDEAGFPQYFWTPVRQNGGGWGYLAESRLGGFQLHRFRPWIAVDDHFVDAASGDSVQFTLSFPSSAALADYRVLGSARGLGTFEPPVGVPVPLLPDLWTNKSWRGDYGPVLNAVNLHGQLDANAQATGTLQFPAGSLAAYVGRPLHFCAVALDAQGAPAWSSAPVLVGVRP